MTNTTSGEATKAAYFEKGKDLLKVPVAYFALIAIQFVGAAAMPLDANVSIDTGIMMNVSVVTAACLLSAFAVSERADTYVIQPAATCLQRFVNQMQPCRYVLFPVSLEPLQENLLNLQGQSPWATRYEH